MKKQCKIPIIIITCIFIIFISHLTEQVISNQYPEVTIKNTKFFTLSSSYSHDEYEIYVSLPLGYKTADTTYSVIYFLDGDITFGFATDTYRLVRIGNELPELIIVTIADAALPRQEGNNRSRDYTPSNLVNKPNAGGAKNFASFIQNELIPFINANYKTNPSDRTIGDRWGIIRRIICAIILYVIPVNFYELF